MRYSQMRNAFPFLKKKRKEIALFRKIEKKKVNSIDLANLTYLVPIFIIYK